ncbi:MAG: hypothetical protein MK086_00780 [Flavobacteriales bacterium]|nr:hypothetical protein [Flavobacteriales bacterium]
MKNFLLLLMIIPSCLVAQEKIGNKIYKYGDVYHSILGSTVISFEDADAKSMNKTLEYFSKAGAKVQSWNSIFLPGSDVSEEEFSSVLDANSIETLVLIDIIESSGASMSRTTASAYSTVNKKKERSSSSANSAWTSTSKGKSSSASSSVSTTKNVNYITEMSLRLTIFSRKDGFNAPVAVIEGRATNDSPDTSADQLARRIVRRMAKALEDQRAF